MVVGANTRALACSVKKLGYKVFAADYFGVMDLRPCADTFKSVLDQKPGTSCGKFIERYNSHIIEEMALEMVDDVDGVILGAGVSHSRFPSNKIIGNYDPEDVEDKFRLSRKLRDDFNVPETHSIRDMDEALDIASSSPEKKYILKPRIGSGGYGVQILNFTDNNQSLFQDIPKIEDKKWILQEYIKGDIVSASVLSTETDAMTILTSSQIIGDESLGQIEPFGYCGNIVPYNCDLKISEIAEEVVSHLSLIGSNGVDFILKNGELYVVEVNPRPQGTFECAELSLNINMAKAHIEASMGQIMNIPEPSEYAVKMIIHAHQRSQVGKLDIEGVYDLPNQGVIIEKGEPMVTVIESGRVMKNVVYSAKKTVQKVYQSVNPAI